jgi:hypothetical protein
MATTFYMSPITLMIQFFTNVGIVLNGGFINVYAAGSVNTPVTTYTDSTGTTANANPIALSSAGRMVAAGTGAPVACWVAQGLAHKMVLTDSSGNQLVSIDNLTAIGDPSTVLNLLASAASGAGASLVANAAQNYFNFATLRASPVPAPVSGQVVTAIVAGQSTLADGLGGAFVWNSTSTATDDNYATIKLTTSTSSGRYLRVQPGPFYSPAPASNYGTFTGTLNGNSAAQFVSCSYYLLGQAGFGQLAFVLLGTGLGTSTSTTLTLTGAPNILAPGGTNLNQFIPCQVEDNGTIVTGCVELTQSTSIMVFGKGPGAIAGFTGTGTKGIPNITMIGPYQLS